MRGATALVAVMVMSVYVAAASAQAPVTPGAPPPQVVPPPTSGAAPDAQPPAAPPQAPPEQTVPGAPAAPGTAVPPLSRTFTAKAGLLFNTVRPDRVKDFETVMWYLQQALEKSTDATVRAQAQGWKIFRASEPGPNNVVLYVFVLDPAVPGADYSLGRILADAYPEQIREIWRLYTGSVTGGGTLMNLTATEPMPPMPLVPVTPDPAGVPAPRTPPPVGP